MGNPRALLSHGLKNHWKDWLRLIDVLRFVLVLLVVGETRGCRRGGIGRCVRRLNSCGIVVRRFEARRDGGRILEGTMMSFEVDRVK